MQSLEDWRIFQSEGQWLHCQHWGGHLGQCPTLSPSPGCLQCQVGCRLLSGEELLRETDG